MAVGRITGFRTITYMRDNGPLVLPGNLANAVVKTHTDVDGGAFVSVTGAGDADGGFAVIGVPNGPTYLQVGNQIVLTPLDSLDYSSRIMGRPSQNLAPSPTQLTINASGFAPWAASNAFGMSCTNLGVNVESLSGLGAMDPAIGSTSAQLTFNYAAGDMKGLVEAAAGDTLVLTHNQRFFTPAQYRAATASATITGLTQLAGQSSIANAVFAPLPLTTVPLDWKVTQFEAFRTTVNPTATLVSHQLVIDAVAGQGALGVAGKTHPLLYMSAPPGAADISGSAQFGNPFPNTLEVNATYSAAFSVMVQAPGAAPTSLLAGISHRLPLSLAVGPIQPGLSPPRNITINGMPAVQPLVGVGTSPTLAWTPPALGTPGQYIIVVSQLTNVAGQTRVTPIGYLRLKGTKARLPPGLMLAGNTYSLTIIAYLSGNVDIEQKPLTIGRTLEYAEAIIGATTP